MLRFDHPEFLWLALLAIPQAIFGWRALALSDGLRRAVILSLRTIMILALAVVLAGPRIEQEHDHLTVIGVLDISGSVKRFGGLNLDLTTPGLNRSPPAIEEDPDQPARNEPDDTSLSDTGDSTIMRPGVIEHLRQWFRTATQIKEPDDRFGLVVFDGRAIAVSAPTKADYVDDNLDVPLAPGTNIEAAIQLALAMFPPDTARRLVLVTDGNETAGNVREAVRTLGGSDVGFSIVNIDPVDNAPQPNDSRQTARTTIPIDVLPIAYRIERDVQVVRVEAPPAAMPGQTVTVRVVLESTRPTTGSITLLREGVPVNISGDPGGVSRTVDIPAGTSVHLATVTLGSTPVNRFEAIVETADPTHNMLPDNDRAAAFTATPSKGSALVVDPLIVQRENALAAILNAADIPTQAQSPSQFPNDLLSLQNYDLIVLDNVAAYELSESQQELLARYVNDLGGGLIMAGGENSFGAGGWKGSPVADLLPVNVDPARELRLPTAALVLVLDKSGSMNHPVAGARATQQQVANEGAALAIRSLHSENLVGVVTFDTRARTLIPLQPNDDPKQLMERVRSISPEGGTDLEPALRLSMNMLRNATAARKRVVFMTDGRSTSDDGLVELARQMAESDIQLTTIAVGDDADHELLAELAHVGGGEFYAVRDPRRLPNVLMDSVQVINKPLIKELSFTPVPLPTGSTITAGMSDAPPLAGIVITAPRDDPKALVEMTDPDGEPLLATWQAGLGRVAAFTSSSPAPDGWAHRWIEWPTAAAFWTQLARQTSRPAMDPEAELLASIQGDRLNITLDVSRAEDGATATGYVQVDGTVYQPDGTATPVRLRQTAPARYETAMDAPLAGNYIIALNPRQGSRLLAPVIGGANRSTSPEFRRYVSNLALLEEIVASTGGRRLNIENPTEQRLFDREGLPHSVSALPAWRTLLIWALALLLLDVASRRIAWDSRVLRALVARAVAKVTPARLRGAQVAATLATLRRVSDDMDARHERRGEGIDRLRPTGRVAPPPVRGEPITFSDDVRPGGEPDVGDDDDLASTSESAVTPPTRSVPDEEKVSAALDALLDRSKPPVSPSSPPPERSKDDAGKSAAETTSNLLAAKRRAREQMKDNA